MEKLGKEFFDHICNKIDWPAVLPVSHTYIEKYTIALLVELNLNVATMNKLLMELFEVGADGVAKPEPNLVHCPKCSKDIVPNNLGYCPNCKRDLAQFLKSDQFHLGQKVDN